MTSEPQSLATEAMATWGLDFAAVGDPHHEILDTTRARGWLDLFVNDAGLLEEARDWAAHPNGYFQPGVLALSKSGQVLYRWRSRPTRENVGGAIMRPTAGYAWQQIRSGLDGLNNGEAQDAALDDTPEFDAKTVAWPLFMLILLAHGWFLTPKVFPEGRAGEKKAKPAQMWPRIGVFACLLLAAFVLLPTLWVTLGLVAWAAYVAPKIARYNREFQNIPVA